MAEYWNNPVETSEALPTRDDGATWLRTGDLAYVDEDGFVFLVDRKKDLIKTSGFQVWPREIEEVISAHPAVLEVGVAGVPDGVKGEVAHAWVVLRNGQAATEDNLREYCRERLAPYKVPARVHFRTELPKTTVGKVLRRALATTTSIRQLRPCSPSRRCDPVTPARVKRLADGQRQCSRARRITVDADGVHVDRSAAAVACRYRAVRDHEDSPGRNLFGIVMTASTRSRGDSRPFDS